MASVRFTTSCGWRSLNDRLAASAMLLATRSTAKPEESLNPDSGMDNIQDREVVRRCQAKG